MADSKISNLNARIYQGYDPNTEFKENGTLLSAARFADTSLTGDTHLFEELKSSVANIKNLFQNSFSASDNQTETSSDSAAPYLSNSNGGSIMSNPSGYSDPNSYGGGNSESNAAPQGNNAQGGQLGSAPSGHDFSAVSDANGSPANSNATPDGGPLLIAPDVMAQGSVTNEGDPIALDITVMVDPQPGVNTTLILSGVPSNATLSAGVKNQDGTWTLTPAQLSGLILTPDPHTSGEITLSVTAISRLGDEYALDVANFKLTIEETIVIPPAISFNPVNGMEDAPAQLNISGNLSADVPGLSSVTISNVPGNATFSAGTNNHDGSWTFTPAQLSNLSITPPSNYSGDLNLTVTAEGSDNGNHTTSTASLHVSIIGIADMPILSVAPSSGNENTAIALNISGALTDTDGSETLSFMVFNLPAGATLSAGTDNGDGSWTLTTTQMNGLTLNPPANYHGSFVIDVLAVSSEGNTHAYADTQMTVTVNQVVGAPNLATSAASGNEDTAISLNISSSIPNGSPGTLSVTISGVPAGATLSAGANNGNGSWSLTAAQLTNLKITPPANYSGDFNLTVTATATDNGIAANTISTLPVHVDGVPDVPNLSVQAATGQEHMPIALNISSSLVDNDGSETLSITITGVPAGATLSAGTNNGNGTWTLTPAQLANLTLTTPASYSGSFNLGVIATASENGQSASTNSTSLGVTVTGVAGTPTLNVSPASGNEDTAISLNITSSIADNDGSETLAITISNVPAGATLSAGTNNGNGTWTLTPAQLTNLKITPPSNFSGTINLNVTATSSEDGTSAQVSSPLAVTVAGVPDVPSLHVQASSGEENTAIALNITAALTDTDGSETLSVTVTGVPAGAILSAGTNNGNGTWTLTPAQLTNLKITPPAFFSGNFDLGVVATASENGQTASTSSSTLSVTVGAVADTPTLNVSPVSGNEDTAIALNINAGLNDNDGSETLAITISGVPSGATLSAGTNNGGGIWTLTPAQLTNLTLTAAPNYSGTINLTVTATSSENGTTAQVTSPLVVTVGGVADTPTLNVGAVSGGEDTAIALNIGAALTDTDGSETLTVRITGVPSGATLSAGTNLGGGIWNLTSAQLANLKITPPANFSGSFNLGVTATASENGTTAQTSGTIAVTVSGVADAPTLNIHAVTGNEDTSIALNIGAGLVDTDGSETLAIQISGVPTGATLSAGTNAGGGVWNLTPAQLTNLTLTPASNYSGSFNLTVTATSSENSTTAQTSGTLQVTVHGVADTPNLTVQAATGNEDTAIALNITSSLTDTDGSEALSIVVSGIPNGAFLSAGLNNGNGTWTLTPAQLTNLTLTPPSNFAGTINLNVTAVSTETNGGDDATKTLPVTVTVTGVADAPNLVVSAALGKEDTAIALNISSSLKDTDGSESLAIKITGVPTGATLSAGTNAGGGVWNLTAAQLTNLKITPPLNSSADFTLTVTATSTDGSSTSPVSASIPVTVTGNADIPTITATNTAGAKNTAVAVNISGAVTDTDGSETVTYLISGVPDGFSFNKGTNNGNNTWTMKATDVSGLTLTSPYNFEGKIFMTARSVSHDDDGSTMQSLPANFNVGIGNPLALSINLGLNVGVAGIGVGTALGADVNTGGLLNLGGIVVHEDAVFPLVDANLLLGLAAGITYVTINGLPAGASLSAGVDVGGGSWKLTTAELLTNISLRLPPNSDQDFTLTITAKLAIITVQLALVDVHVLGVADTPTLSVSTTNGTEDASSVHVNVTSALTDTDGSETLSFMIKDLPTGFIPTVGIDNGDGTWSLTAAQIGSLDLKPPSNFSGDATFTIVAVSTEREGDSTMTSTVANIHIDPVADAPTIMPGTNSGFEDTPLALNLGIALTDTDGSESISAVTISGLANGFSLSGATNNGNGTWSVNPAQLANLKLVAPTNWHGDTSFSVTAVSKEGLNGPTASTTTTVNAHIEAVADMPSLSVQNASGIDHHSIGLNISASLNDNDGSEHLSVVISNVPDHFVFSQGLNNGNGSWSFTENQLHNLSVTSNDFSGDAHLSVDVFAEDANHTIATAHADLMVHVTPDT